MDLDEILSSDPDTYSCDDCNKQCQSYIQLIRHRLVHNENFAGRERNIDGDKILDTCPICSIDLTDNYFGTRLAKSEEQIKCHIDFKVFYDENFDPPEETTTTKTSRRICPHCRRGFPRRIHLKWHIETWHAGDQKYPCENCAKIFPTKPELKAHIVTHAVRHFDCVHCKQDFETLEQCKMHYDIVHTKRDKTYRCDQCPKVFTTRGGQQLHGILHTDRCFVCKFCRRKFPRQADLKRHELSMHINPQLFHCSICDKSYSSKEYLKIHEETHDEAKSPTCPHCHKKFSSKLVAKRHIEMFHVEAEQQHTCGICSMVFTRLKYLEYHKVSHSNERYSCSECSKVFLREQNRNRHFQRMHINGGQQHICNECDKVFSRPESLSYHKRLHSGQYLTCPECSKKFVHRRDLGAHIKRMHTKQDEEYPCLMCPKVFTRTQTLREHEKIHMAEGFSCSQCTARFATGKYLRNHIYRKHTTQSETYACDKCDRVYKRLESLRVHQSVHRGNWVTCNLCPKKFPRQSALNYHIKRTHERGKFQCDDCGKEFDKKVTLKYHQQKTHQNVVHRCKLCDNTYTSPSGLYTHLRKIHLKISRPSSLKKAAATTIVDGDDA